MLAKKKLLVVTDLDGSLLDNSYSWQAARPALQCLKTLKIPLVLNSSKTISEMKYFTHSLGTLAPVVAENGGLLAVPQESGLLDQPKDFHHSANDWIQVTGLSRDFILSRAHSLRVAEGYLFEGFADWSDAMVTEHTGLSSAAASRAQSRHATEPILWKDTLARRATFERSLAKDGIRLLMGGRFLHLMGPADKASGTVAVKALYQKAMPDVEWVVVALGDSQNDQAMLEVADIAVVIPHAGGRHISPQGPDVRIASMPATAGWNEAILTIIRDELGSSALL
ncbi:MAG: HAD-IIB family hydrolase [Opitutae bacterium]|jgi:mannosyl-3-phosphoglycerate phosphatase|nr:HAD-IIB family hydrolase [Opitutae bacterium]MDG1300062.1 HAD-IIB family hydrolase [Opitutae bacterium]